MFSIFPTSKQFKVLNTEYQPLMPNAEYSPLSTLPVSPTSGKYTFLHSTLVKLICHLLGGLSLHLNHLIAWQLGISFQQFGTLPIGIFLVKFGLKTPYDIS